jgi:hypothetical protein
VIVRGAPLDRVGLRQMSSMTVPEKPTGRGVFLIKQLMDKVEFADGGRELVMQSADGRPA